mgnify:CR=1 FL=1
MDEADVVGITHLFTDCDHGTSVIGSSTPSLSDPPPAGAQHGRAEDMTPNKGQAPAGRAASYGQSGRSAFDPWANAVVSAGMVRDTGGWSHWSCKP